MATIFSKIIAGEIPCYKIAEDTNFLAFLDIRPLQRGHTLIVPKVEVDYVFDLETDLLAAMLPFAKKVAVAIKQVCPCERIGLAVVGLEVPHAHLHLIPINQMSDMDFQAPRPTFTTEDFEQTAQAIKAAL
jgi:histidine triad (HIT) family protein